MYTICKYFEELETGAFTDKKITYDRKLVFAVAPTQVERCWQERRAPAPNKIIICKKTKQNYIVYDLSLPDKPLLSDIQVLLELVSFIKAYFVGCYLVGLPTPLNSDQFEIEINNLTYLPLATLHYWFHSIQSGGYQKF